MLGDFTREVIDGKMERKFFIYDKARQKNYCPRLSVT
jgi:hypothetical protein